MRTDVDMAGVRVYSNCGNYEDGGGATFDPEYIFEIGDAPRPAVFAPYDSFVCSAGLDLLDLLAWVKKNHPELANAFIVTNDAIDRRALECALRVMSLKLDALVTLCQERQPTARDLIPFRAALPPYCQQALAKGSAMRPRFPQGIG